MTIRDAGAGTALDLADREAAREFIARLLRESGNAPVLRQALAEVAPGTEMGRGSEGALVDALSRQAAAGRVRFVRPEGAAALEPEVHGASVAATERKKESSSPPPRTRSKTWIKIQVVDESSGEPVPGVRLRVATPDGVENFHNTTSEGLVALDEIDHGSCTVRCDTAGAKPDNTLYFAGMGEESTQLETAQENGSRPGGLKRILEPVMHKVRKGESIDSLAKSVGLTWQALSLFNWGTDKPTEINRHLRDSVGCTKKTKDGKNYLFDDSDNPGLLILPTPWAAEDLATTRTHIIRVRPPQSTPPWFFSI